MSSSSRLHSVVSGALGGLLGGLLMKAFVNTADPSSFGLSDRTDAKTTHKLTRQLGLPYFNEETAQYLGAAMHYSFAVGAGAAYGSAALHHTWLGSARGLWFGAALWIVGDEIAVSASRLEDPFQTSITSHCSALIAHLLYGTVLDATVRAGTMLRR